MVFNQCGKFELSLLIKLVEVGLLVIILQSTLYDRWSLIDHYVEHTQTDSQQ